MTSTTASDTWLKTKHPVLPWDERLHFDGSEYVNEKTGQKMKHHTYFVNGTASVDGSVTSFVKEHFSPFNADAVASRLSLRPSYKYEGMSKQDILAQWEQIRNEAAEKGTEMHAKIELTFNRAAKDVFWSAEEKTTPPQKKLEKFVAICNDVFGCGTDLEVEKKQLISFCEEVVLPKGWRPYRTELIIYDEMLRLPGSVDMIFCMEQDEERLIIVDWKRSRHIQPSSFSNRKGLPPCCHDLPDCNLTHYGLQINVYSNIIERLLKDKKVLEMYVVSFHASHPSYSMYDVSDAKYGAAVEKMMLARYQKFLGQEKK